MLTGLIQKLKYRLIHPKTKKEKSNERNVMWCETCKNERKEETRNETRKNENIESKKEG